MALNESMRRQIADLVSNHPVVLFMKGTREAPQCGFSAKVVNVLDRLLPDYETVDVLGAPEIREAIKEYSAWPTLPQLYVQGKFIGGCDIVRELDASGELKKLLNVSSRTVAVPMQASSRAAPVESKSAPDSVATTVRESIERRIPGANAIVDGRDGHFRIEVTSSLFAGKGMLERQREVYDAIAHLMRGAEAPVHAIDSLHTRTPLEA